MEKDNILQLAHTWLRDLKASRKVSYKMLGDIIGYSDTGMGKALKKDTLSFEQIKLIAIEFGLLKEFSTNFTNYEKENESTLLPKEYKKGEQLGVYLKRNHEALLAFDPTYAMFIDNISADRAMLMVKDILSNK